MYVLDIFIKEVNKDINVLVHKKIVYDTKNILEVADIVSVENINRDSDQQMIVQDIKRVVGIVLKKVL